MSAALRVSAAARNAMLNKLRDALDAGAGAGRVRLYTGAQPATPETAVGAQVLLGTLTLSDPSAPNAAGGALTLEPVTEDPMADATGTATWARLTDSDGTAVLDCSVGLVDSGAALEFDTVSFLAGGAIRMQSGVVTIPAS